MELKKNAKAQRFSITHNLDNFIHNVNLFFKDNDYNITAEDWRIGNNNRPEVLCLCKCGNKYWRMFNLLKYNKYDLCPICSKSESLLERQTEQILINNNINYIKQKRFDNCKFKKTLPFDFYLIDYNTCIEVNGIQHYEPIAFGGISMEEAIENFKYTQKCDNIKYQYCINNNIKLLRIPYWEFNKNEDYKKLILNILNI